MNAKDIKTILYNPFWGSKIVPYFLAGCPRERIKLELAYLLFPFIFYQDSRMILTKLNARSTLYSAFLGDFKGRVALAGLERRYTHFKPLTSQSIIVAANDGSVEVGEFLSLHNSVDYKKEKDIYYKQYFKAAYYLGRILSRLPHTDTFVKLGLREL